MGSSSSQSDENTDNDNNRGVSGWYMGDFGRDDYRSSHFRENSFLQISGNSDDSQSSSERDSFLDFGRRNSYQSSSSSDGSESSSENNDVENSSDTTSSRESRNGYSPYDSFVPTTSLTEVLNYIGRLTIPCLKDLCAKWNLKKSGPKLELFERIRERVLMIYNEGNEDKYNKMAKALNKVYSKKWSGMKPFGYLCSNEAISRLIEESSQHEFSYKLPFPWVLIKKISPPIVTSCVTSSSSNVCINFDVPIEPSTSRFLFVKLKLYKGRKGKLPSYKTLECPNYRHAYLRYFKCSFSETPLNLYNQLGKVQEITSILRSGINTWRMPIFSPYHKKDYYLQVVEARRDPTQWVKSNHQLPRKPSQEILEQLRYDFNEKSKHGILTSAISVSLRCPLSLQRITIPLRSNRCKHLQCFDQSSWYRTIENFDGIQIEFHCPICTKKCPPDQLYIDGLISDILRDVNEAIDIVTIDPETGSWGIPDRKEVSPSQSKDLQPKTHEIIDLTLTDDDCLDFSRDSPPPYIKPDPGISLGIVNNLPVDFFDPVDIPSSPPLEEADVSYNSDLPVMVRAAEQRYKRGESIYDAIILE